MPEPAPTTRLVTPAFHVRAAVRPQSLNIDARTVDIVWSTGSRGLRWSWEIGDYLEELEISAAAIRLDRLNNGAPLLDTHQRWDLSTVIGVVERAWLEGEEALATVRFSQREDVEAIFRDVRDGIIRNLSVGYFVHRYTVTEESDNKLPIYRATDWEPFEVSFVPFGFDADAQVRMDAARTFARAQDYQGHCVTTEFPTRQASAPADSSPTRDNEVDTMTEEERLAAEEAARAEQDRIRKEAEERSQAAERERAEKIRLMVRKVGLGEDIADDLVKRGVSVADSSTELLDKLAERQGKQGDIKSGLRIEVDTSGSELMREAMQGMLRNRIRPGSVEIKPEWRRYRGLSLLGMAAECIRAAGGDPAGMYPREIAQAALNYNAQAIRAAGMHSTSDFPLILANSVGKTLMAAYQLAAQTFKAFTRRTTVPDFKQIAMVQLGDLTPFEKVNEGGEYKYGTFGESGNWLKVLKYGEIVAITWEAIVNDDLNAFDRIPSMLGAAASQKESAIVWDLVLSNPEYSDGKPVFSAEHGNLAAAGSAITVESLSAGREAMRFQTTSNGNELNIEPAYLIVGPKQELAAYQYTSPNYVPAEPKNVNTKQNTSLQVIVESRIKDYRWYLSADPALVGTIAYAYLEGEEGIFTETREGFEVDGLEVKARLVFGGAWEDYRGMYQNPGAAPSTLQAKAKA
ncbi:prohead protease/major capsid protein fusion protein [Pseudomonas schmalbachii]|uniref:Bacteriophage Mu GpT domain-containing protein n=1 Tax=Pseudomonas schmalbachii TaxID=2816993 RepID=A0ABS3TKG5_9PSED|nr:prohead protease/major capsid protein fusion protein [Pseudomonas schmalbachii]MBO3274135.1 hypothetical protein [Pseudomonas schmalbachii]